MKHESYGKGTWRASVWKKMIAKLKFKNPFSEGVNVEKIIAR